MDEPKGNSCLYCLFMVSNFGLLFVGFGTIAAGIYVAADLDHADWYNISFIGLGFLTILVFSLGCQTRRSLTGTCCYLFFTFCIFVTQLSFSLAIIFYTEFEKLLGAEYANAVRYTMLAFCLAILGCFLLGWWYRNSLLEANFDYHIASDHDSYPGELFVTEPINDIKPKYQELREKYRKG